ncbi:hypothetical protein Q7P35_008054 [Cladosporium inversicolor]
METKTARPVGSHHRATGANNSIPIAIKRPQTWEGNAVGSGGSSDSKQHARAAPIATRPMATTTTTTTTTTGSKIPVPGPSKRSTGSAPIHSRPGPASPAARNFSRPQGVSGSSNDAAPLAARPNMRGKAVREVGFHNWAVRHESIAAHPVRRRARPTGIPSAILEEDEDGDESDVDVLPALLSSKERAAASEMQVHWQGERAKRSPALVRACAAPVRSHAASLVAATESASASATPPPARHSWPKRAPRPAVLPSSPLRHSVAQAPKNPRTYLEMHASYERPSTLRCGRVGAGGAALDLGENFSPYSAGTTVKDIRRRAALGVKFPLPANAVTERRVFSAPFVDVPTLIGGGKEVCGPVGGRARMEREEEFAASSEVVPVPAPLEGEGGERKKGWQKVSAFLARRMGRKKKGAASPSSSPASEDATPSPRTPGTPPSLVYGSSLGNDSPAPAPGTPPQVRFAAPVVISGPPYSTPRQATAEKKDKQPVSPPRKAPPPRSPPQKEHLARAVTAASALPLHRIPEEGEEDEHSPPPPSTTQTSSPHPSSPASAGRSDRRILCTKP